MAGNVREWTRSLWDKGAKCEFAYPYDPLDPRRERFDAEDDIRRVVRGGSWYYLRVFARCAFRFRGPPVARSVDLGFRVVLRAAPVSSTLSSDDSEL
jgi:formylglycine-generating enzyme required for sulfatase activity